MLLSKVDIIVYHDVCGPEENYRIFSNPMYTTNQLKLEEHINWFEKQNYQFINIQQWLKARRINKKKALKGKFLILTFDGPHSGWFKNVLPLLAERRIPASFFITAGWVGKNHLYPESRSISWDEIANICEFTDENGNQLFEVGSHSMWHTVFEKQPNETKKNFHNRLHEEIVESTEKIRKKTGLTVCSFAPPKGRGNLIELEDYIRKANIRAVRWASLPGRRNDFFQDLFDLQISYCDTVFMTKCDLKMAFANKWFKSAMKTIYKKNQ